MSPAVHHDVLRALADPTRQQILEFLLRVEEARRRGECFAGTISQALGLSQPTISHHMKVLVDAGLVKATKKGTSVYYCLGNQGFQVLHDHLTPYLEATSETKETT
ncbi:ArsR/SmtB family transcription factor [Deinococcus malanensis]|uniref:ArsR/SmtB family transcription factor n=1 Tax=Deinococcus malanensis TaxID=1706855 RepID=UPI0016670DE1|nr:metalloregulator ArsR/SmtB family transcription factor [Deinococcus malanensis]